jgi:fucose permease
MSASLAERDAGGGRRAAVSLLYTGAFVQCMAQVSFAASATVFRERLSFTDAQYGSIFLPQITLATLGAIGGGALARRVGLRSLLVAGSLALAAAEAALLASLFVGPAAALATVMAGTGLMGLGAGLSAAPMNAYPQLLFPFRRDTALVGVHAVNGLGLTAGPLLAGALLARDAWPVFPAVLFALNLALALASLRTPLPRDPRGRADGTADTPEDAEDDHAPARTATFWAFVLMAFSYALAEGSFASWAVIFLREDRGLSAPLAAFGLALFWTGLTVGRMLVASFVLRFRPEPLWLGLPLVMAALLCSVPLAATEGTALAFFAIAGLACSGFFPLTIGMASRRFPRHVASVSSMVYAGLALGVGAGPFVMGLLRTQMPLTRLFALSAVQPIAAVILAGFVLLHQGERSATR